MISVIQNMDIYEIRFPYDKDIIDIIKQVPGRRWEPSQKIWTIPKARLGFLLNGFKGTTYESDIVVSSNEDINVNASINDQNPIPEIDISEYNYRIQDGYNPYKHQIDSLKLAKWRYENGLKSGFLLADQPGSGKTLQIANIALYMHENYDVKHCLIVACVNAAKYNWQEDIIKHTNGQEVPYILGSRLKRDGSVRLNGSSDDKLEDLTEMKMYGKKGKDPLPFFIILNIEAIRMRKGKVYPISNRLVDLINSGEIGIIALDEIHRNCSMSSLQGKELMKIKKKVAAADIQWYPITGTPITSKPTDVFLPLRLVDGHEINSYYSWCQNFCVYGGFGGYEIVAYKNIPMLKNMLQPNMLRRLKKDILDLPPKIHFTEYIENTKYQKDLYNIVANELREDRSEILMALNPMSKLLRLRQVNGSPELVDTSLTVDDKYLSKNAKLARLLDLVDEIVSNDEKVVIFSNWVDPLKPIHKFLKARGHKVCCYTGTMSQEDRQKHKQVFINNPSYKVMIGTVGALGTSHTLTVARNVIFYDSPWNPADIEQCEDRCHRPGTNQSVNVYSLISKDTVDDKVHQILSKKEGTSQYIVDNNLDIRNHPELLDMFISEIK